MVLGPSPRSPITVDATLHGLKGQTQFFSFIGIPLNSSPEHRPVTKAQLFKPTLYKSYCEGSFACEPNDIIGPQRNRVLTLIIAFDRRFWVYEYTSVYEYKLESVFLSFLFLFNEFTRVYECGEIIVYSWSTINAYSLLSHEWWIPLIKFMMGPIIYVRGRNTHLWFSEST